VKNWPRLFSIGLLLTAGTVANAGIDIGPAMGEKIPGGFIANDKTGAPKKFSDIVGKSGVVLFFNRSAKWCPFCQAQMVDINGIKDKLQERGYAMAVLTYDPPEVLAGFAAAKSISYMLLSDPKSEMIDAFKLRDPRYAPGHFAHGVPKAAVFVLDVNGVVQAKLAEEDFKVRPTTTAILDAVASVRKN
jgi:peroxiredoxin